MPMICCTSGRGSSRLSVKRLKEMPLREKKVEEMLQDEVEKLGDAAYACYEQGFDEALA